MQKQVIGLVKLHLNFWKPEKWALKKAKGAFWELS
jgi:hypothetical protein